MINIHISYNYNFCRLKIATFINKKRLKKISLNIILKKMLISQLLKFIFLVLLQLSIK